MTDARFPERWLTDRRLQLLSDAHFRSFVTSLAWSVSNRTDGVIEPTDLALIPNFAVGAPQALVDANLWAPRSSGWSIVDFETTQTTSSQLQAMDKKRARERIKKANQRAGKKDDDDPANLDVPADVPGDVPGDSGEDVPGGHKGQARTRQGQGKDREEVTTKVAKLSIAACAEEDMPACRYCGGELKAHQHARGHCGRSACYQASREARHA